MKILITGSSSGIGRYLAGRLMAGGHEIWGAARSRVPRPDNIGGSVVTFRYSSCDLSSWSAVRRLRAEVGEEWSSLDGLISCVGSQAPVGFTMDLDPLEWSAAFRSNLDGTFFPIRAFFDLLCTRSTGKSRILCFSGGGATSARPNFTSYACAKTAVTRLVENLSAEWQGRPVDINAVAPGAVPTRMTREVLEMGAGQTGPGEFGAAKKLMAAGDGPIQRAGDLIEFLLSEDAENISGRLISAPWDPWLSFASRKRELRGSDLYTLRRIVPADRGMDW